ncbi:MAG: CTP synthase [Candidatus Babeliales bacterium]
MTKFVVVVGGVISGVGKGIITASLGKIIKEYGYRTTLIKIDPYINCDAGTLRPTEHGEVWVTEDGGEIDQDLGTYERFLDENLPKKNNITTGQVYKEVIERERRGEYLGRTVQCIPHISDEIVRRIKYASEGYDVAIVEIGGTVGDYENKPFLFALRSLAHELGEHSMVHVLVAYLPIASHIEEMKTKPAQQAIKMLNEEGISPDFIICRAQYPLDELRKQKIECYANIRADRIISAPDVDSIYQVPLDLEAERMGTKILQQLALQPHRSPDWSSWRQLVTTIKKPQKKITIAIVGKYFNSGTFHLLDSYVSIYQALIHAGAACNTGIIIEGIDAKLLESNADARQQLSRFDGVIVPGGFGNSGVEGKIAAIEYVRNNRIPYLGLCYGMQLAAIEFARHVCGLTDAQTTEVDEQTRTPLIDILPEQKDIVRQQAYGATMRLGAYQAVLAPHSKVYALYNDANRVSAQSVTERHRHRYEVNPAYVETLQKHGMYFSGTCMRNNTQLMEFLELPHHPFFIATQAHPEFTSRLGNPNPLFLGFVQACLERNQGAVQETISGLYSHITQSSSN